MAQTVCVLPPAEDRERLLAIVADRNRPLKHVKRADIVLCSAERLSVQEVARHAGVSRPAVWRWQTRYAEHGVEGLLRDKTRKPGRAPLSAKVVAKVIDLTCSERPGHATHWTGRAMAKAVGVSLRAVQRLWQAHRLQPHRIRTFKRSNDPEFAEKVENIVGLYMDPPKHAVVVSIDEKSQIQALDRTQPGLPLKPGKCGTMTQMAAVHLAIMTFSRRLAHVDTIPQQDSAQNAFNKLARTFAAQVEALKRHRSGGEQKMTVQHVHVAEGGQAIVGNVSTPSPGRGATEKRRNNPMRCPMHHEMPRKIEAERATVSSSGGAGSSVCRTHGAGGGAPRGNRNALKHGEFADGTLALKRESKALARMARNTMAAIE